MTAENYIEFIEQGRRDKVSIYGMQLIATRFRELEHYVTERESKLQERLDIQIEANDNLLAQNKGLMKINSMMKLITELPIHYWLEDTKEDVKKLRKQITALEKELGLNKE
jgi:hypothetical protein